VKTEDGSFRHTQLITLITKWDSNLSRQERNSSSRCDIVQNIQYNLNGKRVVQALLNSVRVFVW
jgi:hypothetical protein